MQLSSLLTDDSRSALEKLRRPQLQKIARENNIPFDPSGPADKLRLLIEGSGVDVLKTDMFEKFQVQDENGRVKEMVEPKVKPHATASKNIDYDAILEAKAKAAEKEEENEGLKKEIDELKALVAKLASQSQEKEQTIEHTSELLKQTTEALSNDELKDQYFKRFGKKPHHKKKIETIKAELDGKDAS